MPDAKKEINKAVSKNTGSAPNMKGTKLKYSFDQKKTPWPLVRKRTLPTERPPLVDEI
jgi:hypothetical protein